MENTHTQYIYITESLCYTAEINTTLQVNYTWIKYIFKNVKGKSPFYNKTLKTHHAVFLFPSISYFLNFYLQLDSVSLKIITITTAICSFSCTLLYSQNNLFWKSFHIMTQRSSYFFLFVLFNWSIVDLQCCISFRDTTKWYIYICMYTNVCMYQQVGAATVDSSPL